VAGVPGVTEALFLARQAALAQERDKSNESPMLYSCGLCGKGYKSEKAHAEHLKSRTHMMRASEGDSQSDGKAIIKPLPQRVVNKPPPKRVVDNSAEDDDSEDEWVEVDSDDDLVDDAAKSLTDMNMDENAENDDMDEDDDDGVDLDPSCCFMCDHKHKTIENCMVHMHKHHGFFIPDVEYLKDPKGLLTYLGLKV
jgi:pre-60S factor REI1